MKVLFVLGLILSSQMSFAATDCKIRSSYIKDLETGVNKNVLCANVIEELVNKNFYSGDNGVLRIVVTKAQPASANLINMKFKLQDNGKKFKGEGRNYWDPDTSVFDLATIKELF